MEIIERKPAPQASSLKSVPEAGTVQALWSLCNPVNTTPTLKSGHIAYGCALLLGEQWDFCLWWDGWDCVSLAAKEEAQRDGAPS